MKFLGMIAAAAAACLACPSATASTVVASGSYDAGFSAYGGGFTLGPGSYRISLAFTDPVEDLFGYVEKITYSDFVCDMGEGEFACGGDDVPTQPLFEMVNAELYQLFLTVDAPAVINYPPGSITVRENVFEECCTYAFDFTSAGAGAYTLSYAAVPEPGAWLMLIIGFGAVGGALRRRNAIREPSNSAAAC